MNKKHFATLIYSAGGIAALVAILIAVNFLIGAFNARVDDMLEEVAIVTRDLDDQ